MAGKAELGNRVFMGLGVQDARGFIGNISTRDRWRPSVLGTAAWAAVRLSDWYFAWLPRDWRIQAVVDGVLLGSSFLNFVYRYLWGAPTASMTAKVELAKLIENVDQRQALSPEVLGHFWNSRYCQREIKGRIEQCNFTQMASLWPQLHLCEQRFLERELKGKTGGAWEIAQLMRTIPELSTKDFEEIEELCLSQDIIETFRVMPDFWLAMRPALLAKGESLLAEGKQVESENFKVLVFKIAYKLHLPDAVLPDFDATSEKVTVEICKRGEEGIEVVDSMEGIYVAMLGLLKQGSTPIAEEVENEPTKRRIVVGADSSIESKDVREMLELFTQGKNPSLEWLLENLEMLSTFGMESFLYIIHKYLVHHHDKLPQITKFSQAEIAQMFITIEPENIKKLEVFWASGQVKLTKTNVLLAMSYATVFHLKDRLSRIVKDYIATVQDPQEFVSIVNHATFIAGRLGKTDLRQAMVTEWVNASKQRVAQTNLHTGWTHLFEMPSDVMQIIASRDHSHIRVEKGGLKGAVQAVQTHGFTVNQMSKTIEALKQPEQSFEDIEGFLKSETCFILAQKIPGFFDHVCSELAKARPQELHRYQLAIQLVSWRLFYPSKINIMTVADKTTYETVKLISQKEGIEAVTIEKVPIAILHNAGLVWVDAEVKLQEDQDPTKVAEVIRKLIASERPPLSWLIDNYALINQLHCKPFLWELQRMIMQPRENDSATEQDLIKIAHLFAENPPFEIDADWEEIVDITKNELPISRSCLLPLMSLASKGKDGKDLKKLCFQFMFQAFLPSLRRRFKSPMKNIKGEDCPLLFKNVYEHAVHLEDQEFIAACQELAVIDQGLRRKGGISQEERPLRSEWQSLFEIPKLLRKTEGKLQIYQKYQPEEDPNVTHVPFSLADLIK